MPLDKADHRCLALWAAACAEHVLTYFEARHPGDSRPRDAIEAARAWARGELEMSDARVAAFAAHAAARAARHAAASAAASSAGHAAATPHIASHASHAADYAVSAAAGAATDAATAEERAWQRDRLPQHLWSYAFGGH